MGWIILVTFLLLFSLALLQPIWVKVTFRPGESQILFTYLGFRFRPGHGKSRKEQRATKPEREPAKLRMDWRDWPQLLLNILRAVSQSIRYLARKILIKRLQVAGQIGLEDPIVMGMGVAALSLINSYHNTPDERIRVTIEPDFLKTHIEIWGLFEGGIRPSSLICGVLMLLWLLPKRQILSTLRAARSEN